VIQDEFIPLSWGFEPSSEYSHLDLQYATAKVFGGNQFQIPVSVHGGIRHTLSRFLFSFLDSELTLWGKDLLWSWVSLYNTIMKLFFIGSSIYILYLMKFPFRPTHDPNLDTFKIEYLLIGSFVAAMVFNYEYSFAEVFLSPSTGVDSRFSGHSASGLRVSRFYYNSSSFKEQEKQKTSRRTIYLLWARIERCISPTGCIDILPIAISTQ